MKKQITTRIALLLCVLILCACGTNTPKTSQVAQTQAQTTTVHETLANTAAPTEESISQQAKPAYDRAGNEIVLPDTVEKIVCIAPSITETLIALGLADKIIAVDKYSTGIEGLPEGLPEFNIMQPDAELLASMQPDILFATGMSKAGGDDPFKPVKDAGICVIYIPTASSLQGILEDIAYMGEVTGTQEKASALVQEMENTFLEYKAISETIENKKTVYFEIAAAPDIYSFGSDVFLHEMLTLVGAENIFADEKSWIPVTEETVVAKNPSIIITNVDYIDDPVKEILKRPGWENIDAVKNAQVFTIDNTITSHPSHYVLKGLKELGQLLYPDIYAAK